MALADDRRGARRAHGARRGTWRAGSGHVRRAAGFVVWSQVEAGHGCPVSMTYAAVPALRPIPTWRPPGCPGLSRPTYDPGLRPAADKAGLLAGMGMTEKQGGSDVRANTTAGRADRRSTGEPTG